MSFSRFSHDCDVYTYYSVENKYVCSLCSFGGNPEFEDVEGLVSHLMDHRNAGHQVPDDLIDYIRSGKEEAGL